MRSSRPFISIVAVMHRIAYPLRGLSVVLVTLVAVTAPAAAQTHFCGWTYVSTENDALPFNEIRVLTSVPVSGVAMVPDFNGVDSSFQIVQSGSNEFRITFSEVIDEGSTFSLQLTAAGEPEFVKVEFVNAWSGQVVALLDAEGLLRDAANRIVGEVLARFSKVNEIIQHWGIILRIHQWGATLLGGNENAMAQFYRPDATLLPTLGIYDLYRNKALAAGKHDAAIIRNYFRYKFLPKRPLMMPLNLGAVHITISGDGNLASANGLYTFVLLSPKGCFLPAAPWDWAPVNARFTFVFKRENGGQPWLIFQHHSSQDPSSKKIKPAKRACLGDLNGDGKVDGADLGTLLGAWGPGGGGTCADINDNGTVDGADLGTLLGNWGVCK